MPSNRSILIAVLMLLVIGGGMLVRQWRRAPEAAPMPPLPSPQQEE